MSNFNIDIIYDRIEELGFDSSYGNKLVKLLQRKYKDIIDVYLTLLNYIEVLKNNNHSDSDIFEIIKDYIDKCDNYKDFVFIDNNTYKDLIEFVNKEKNIYKGKNIELKGVFRCKECDSNNIKISINFTRSLDEPAVIYLTCSNGHTWRDS